MHYISYIRFSSSAQEQGDSIRRQVELSERYAEKHNLSPLKNAYVDRGVSGYSGKNIDSGALHEILSLIENGKIPVGTYLLIESLDRLSRLPPTQAMQLLLRIVTNGVIVVTLDSDPPQVYSSEMDMIALMQSLVIISRAHDESRTKSKRISAHRAQLRKDAIEGKCQYYMHLPFWLTADENKNVVLNEHAEVVKKIFERASTGERITNIAGWLTKSHPFRAWHRTHVSRLLRNPKVIGQITIDGHVLENHYPKAVDDDTFYKVQQIMDGRRFASGRTAVKNINVFNHLVFCKCGSPMWRYRYHTKTDKEYNYLRCSTPYLHDEKKVSGWNYFEFERLFFEFVKEINVDDEVENNVAELVYKRKQIQSNIDRLVDLISDPDIPNSRALAVKIADLENQVEVLNDQIAEEEKNVAADLKAGHKNIVKMFETLLNSSDRDNLRKRLAIEVRNVVGRIEVDTMAGDDENDIKMFDGFMKDGRSYHVLINRYKVDGLTNIDICEYDSDDVERYG